MILDRQTQAADRTAALEWLWTRVMDAVKALRLHRESPAYAPCHDDTMMIFARRDDAEAWLSDLARQGFDVTDARAALDAYLLARDCPPGAPELDVGLRDAAGFARGRLHRFHPVVRGLAAIVHPREP